MTMQQACERDDELEIVKLLLAKGAHLDKRDKQNNAAIHFAAADGNVATVAYLIEQGAAVDEQGWRKQTPLHIACMRKDGLEIVQLLLAKGECPEKRAHAILTIHKYSIFFGRQYTWAHRSRVEPTAWYWPRVVLTIPRM